MAESREQRAESREQRAESREQRAESREQRAENCSGLGFECQGNKQSTEHWKRCCYCNYKKVFKIDVGIAMAVLARDYKGFGSGLIPSNGVIIKT